MVLRFWQNRAIDGIRGASEALFPRNDLGAPDFEQTEVVRRTVEYLAMLPPPERRLVTALFVLVELVVPIFGLKLGRYSKLSMIARQDVVRRLRRSRIYPLRLIGDSIKGVMTMIYMSHPRVVEHIGMFSVCEQPDDPFLIPVKRLRALAKEGVAS